MSIIYNTTLLPHNTFGIDVKAASLMVIEPGDPVPHIDEPFIVVGEGSDMVFTRDYTGIVVVLSHTDCVEILPDGVRLKAWGGMVMDRLVEWNLANGLYGLENLSAIPGTVGAAAVQNVGAYGAEAKDTIETVEAVDLVTGEHRTYNNDECRFGYRTSRFKHGSGHELITYVTFRLSRTYTPNLSYKTLADLPHDTAMQMRQSITNLRWSKLPRPEEYGSAGSFFKNPVVDEVTYSTLKNAYPDMPDAHPTAEGYKLSAGWLIDKAGWKGRSQGRVGVWPQNALVLYNLGGCTGNEVCALSQAIQTDLMQKFGIALSPEAIII